MTNDQLLKEARELILLNGKMGTDAGVRHKMLRTLADHLEVTAQITKVFYDKAQEAWKQTPDSYPTDRDFKAIDIYKELTGEP